MPPHSSPPALTSSSPSTTWLLDAFGQDPSYLAYQEELRTLIFTSAQTAACTRETTPVPPPSHKPDPNLSNPPPPDATAEDANSVAKVTIPPARPAPLGEKEVAEILTVGRRLEYLQTYLNQIAPWLDMFDASRTFTLEIPLLARRSPALLYSLLAVAARQTECLHGTTAAFDSLELYQEAIRLVRPLLLDGAESGLEGQEGEEGREVVVAVCSILCVMEMMVAKARDWRRHLEGCAALFGAHGIGGFVGGVSQAVFWCYARMDLCGALISDGIQTTLIPPAKWLPSPSAHLPPDAALTLFLAQNSPDMHANAAVYLISLVCQLLSLRTRATELGEQNGCTTASYTTSWHALWAALQRWLAERPSELVPIEGGGLGMSNGVFPEMLFLHWSGISSTQLYHTGCILLLSMMPPSITIDGPVGRAVWHAKRVCGISIANPHHGCLNNAIQPLWVAGRLLSHGVEHAVLVRLIRGIEGTTGWRTGWRVRDLEGAWGYRRGEGVPGE